MRATDSGFGQVGLTCLKVRPRGRYQFAETAAAMENRGEALKVDIEGTLRWCVRSLAQIGCEAKSETVNSISKASEIVRTP